MMTFNYYRLIFQMRCVRGVETKEVRMKETGNFFKNIIKIREKTIAFKHKCQGIFYN